MTARPNPDCPSYKEWPAVARRRQAAGYGGVGTAAAGGPTSPSKGLLASLPPDVAPLLSRVKANMRLGVTLRGLRRLREQLVAFFGQERFPTVNTNQVKDEFVAPLTAERRCRLVELPGMVDPEDQGPPMYFISHACRNKTARLFDYVLDYLKAAGEGTTVWLDVFAVNQHEDSPAHASDMRTFGDCVAACSGGAIVVMDMGEINPATRAWCIYEWAHALAVHGPDGFHLQLTPAERAAIAGKINFDSAEAGPKDKAMIREAVLTQHGSTTAFDTALKLQLLLEPLSYSVDLRRLLRRAEGTAWALEPVVSWLRQGEGGSRVLCISSGAGEGKSTISAVLCSSGGQLGQLPAGSVVAFHFLKYSDQRRLDPVRIVKSLAFQLARRIPSIAEALLGCRVDAVAQLSDVEEAFAALLLAPLQGLAQGPSRPAPLVLLIDALDEADPLSEQLGGGSSRAQFPLPVGNRALQLVAKQLARLPPWVRFIFTTRPEAASGQAVPCLHRAFGGEGAVTLVRPSQLRAEPGAGAGASSGGGSGGVMVYHTAREAAAADAVAGSSLPAPPPEPTIADVYDVYGGVFKTWFGRLEGSKAASAVRDLIGVLQAAKEPLGQSSLAQLGLAESVPLLPGSPTLFFVDEHRLYSLHKSLGDWLLDPARSGAFAANTLRGHELLGLLLARTWRNSPAQAYALQHALAHLGAAARPGGGRQGSAEAEAALDGLLADWGFLEAVSALGSLPSHTALSNDVWRWLGAEQHVLASKPSVEEMVAHALDTAPYRTEVNRLALRHRGRDSAPWRTHALLGATGAGRSNQWTAQRFVLRGHESSVTDVAVSPDGRAVASCSADMTARLWDAASGQCTATLEGHMWEVSVVFSPDGQTLASFDNEVVRLWEVASGKQVATLEDDKRRPQSGAFSPDGKTLACFGGKDKIWLWDIESGQLSSTEVVAGCDSVKGLAFSPDGTTLAAGCFDRTVRLWDTHSWQPIGTLEGHTDTVYRVAFSADGKTLASCGSDNTVRLWDPASGQCLATLEGHTDIVWALAFSPDGKTLVSGCKDNTVRLWEASVDRASPEGHSSSVACVAFGPDGSLLASAGCRDRTVRLWDPASGLCTSRIEGLPEHVQALAFSPDGSTLATGGSDSQACLWSVATGQCTASLEGHEGWVNAVAFSPDGKRLASGGNDQTARLWDTASGRCTATLEGHRQAVNAVAFSPDGRTLASGSGANENYSTTPADNTPGAARGWARWTSSLGAALAASTRSNMQSVWLWDMASKRCVRKLAAYEGWAEGVAFSPDGRTLAGANVDKTVCLWDVGTGHCHARLEGHSDPVVAVAFSPDGRSLASGGNDKMVRLWQDMAPQDPRWALQRCALAGDAAGVRRLLEAEGPGIASFSPPKTGWTPLHAACKAGDVEGVRLLLAAGASPDAATPKGDAAERFGGGETPLHVACGAEHGAVVWALLGAGSDAGAAMDLSAAEDTRAATPLHLACLAGSTEAVAALLEAGGKPQLEAAVVMGPDGLPMLGSCLGFGREAARLTPLQVACARGLVEVAALLLGAGASVSAALEPGGETPLHLASVTDQAPTDAAVAATIGALLKAGAALEAATQTGATALQYACNAGSAAAVRALLQAGANKDLAIPDGYTLLHMACAPARVRSPYSPIEEAGAPGGPGQVEVVRALLAAGVPLEATSKGGFTALHVACWQGRTEAARALLEAGADQDAATQADGLTPLHMACAGGRFGATRALLEAGARRDAKTSDGSTALDLAEGRGELLELLEGWGGAELAAKLAAMDEWQRQNPRSQLYR
ncbi:hypothetical protein HYH03_009908 [Edaphochlamys debaryana]|uniref:Nephrocystin 3-like N-terminal domain-containing protein n=1 Tax=Edaphochlamys debaryana TaxID=47281 RepID=A0A835XXL5_9CHLO|nr:hypothetical protein HYH03_009908 [Edaphochlamys debaryana]|eukprot:KAG2491745.1 hypothetical protein HYH03_009908 [Edaphochlamys debaryana]